MKYWLCLLGWCGDVSYGVDEATYLFGIYKSEEEAERAAASQKFKDLCAEIERQHDSDEGTYPYVVEFDPEKNQNIENLLFLGGGYYLE